MQELKRALVLTFPFGGESTSRALSTLISRINDVGGAKSQLLLEQPFFAVLTSCVCPHLSHNCCRVSTGLVPTLTVERTLNTL